MNTIRNLLLPPTQKTSFVPPQEVEILLAYILKKPKEFILAHPEYPIPKKLEEKIKALLYRRECGEPLAYITKTKEFFGINFLVTPDTLIPRPETEILVEKSLDHIITNINPISHSDKTSSEKNIVIDIGTGTGCLLISILAQLKNKNIFLPICWYGFDVSKRALAVAKQNAQKHISKNDITFVQSDLLEYALHHPVSTKSITLIANLPYVPSDYLSKKKTKLTQGLTFEPLLALDGGKDGFTLYRKLLSQIKTLKNTHKNVPVYCFFEIGSDQQSISRSSIKKEFPSVTPIFFKDLIQHTRVVFFSL